MVTLRSTLGLAVAASVAFAVTGCGGPPSVAENPSVISGLTDYTGSYPDVDGGDGTAEQSLARDLLNEYRIKCRVGNCGLRVPLNHSATLHGGYQTLRDRLGYFETTTGEPTAPADTTNPLYREIAFEDRILRTYAQYRASGVTPLLANPIEMDEKLCQFWRSTDFYVYPTPITRNFIWRGWRAIYYRLPMMRHGYRYVGYSDLDTVSATFPNADYPTATLPSVISAYYTTMDWGAEPVTFRSISAWPTDRETGTWNAYKPTPDLFPENDYPTVPSLAERSNLGLPIHIIHTTQLDWTGIECRLTPVRLPPDYPTSPPIPTGSTLSPPYIIYGGAEANLSSDSFFDTALRRGEIFFVPKSLLGAGWYMVQLKLTTLAETVTYQWVFRTT